MPVYFTKFPIFMFVICSCFTWCTSFPIQNDTLQASNFSTLLPINANETQLIAINFTDNWSSSSLSSSPSSSSLPSSSSEEEETNSSMSTDDPTLYTIAISTVNYSATMHPNEPIGNVQESETESELISEESNMNSTSQDIDLIQDDDEEDDDDEAETEDKDYVPIPSVLANLPHDIPPDRSIVEVLAENAVKDKQYDELRLEELLHEMMTHSLGYGEFYPDEVEYDDIEVPVSRAERAGKKNGRKRHSRRSHVI